MHELHNEEYKNLVIRIAQDETPSNPFSDWGCEPPIIVISNGYASRWDTWEYGLDFSLPMLTRDQVKANLADIKGMLGCDRLLPVCRDFFHFGGKAEDLVNDALRSQFEGESKSDQLETIAVVLGWTGTHAEVHARTGYSQGDYIEVLVAMTPEFIKESGVEPDAFSDQCESAADLYAAYAFGDVYGFIVENAAGEELEACWGFYGYHDFDNYGGALPDARAMADSLSKKLVRKVCRECGSEDVLCDSYAQWNVKSQSWELQTTFDKGAFCNSCEGECTIVDAKLEEEKSNATD